MRAGECSGGIAIEGAHIVRTATRRHINILNSNTPINVTKSVTQLPSLEAV